MNAALAVLRNSSPTFSLYDFYVNGVSADDLAAAYELTLAQIEERLEAARLCLQFQVKAQVVKPKFPVESLLRAA